MGRLWGWVRGWVCCRCTMCDVNEGHWVVVVDRMIPAVWTGGRVTLRARALESLRFYISRWRIPLLPSIHPSPPPLPPRRPRIHMRHSCRLQAVCSLSRSTLGALPAARLRTRPFSRWRQRDPVHRESMKRTASAPGMRHLFDPSLSLLLLLRASHGNSKRSFRSSPGP